MTNAESIVKEYLARGYSLESLRLLAESRGQPLCGEMLAVLEAMAANGELPAASEDSGPCETAAYPVARGEEGSVFFIADDEQTMAEDGAVDFDVMAGTTAREESVAEIFIGDTDGSAMIAADSGNAPAPEGAAQDDIGIWSRLWSRVSGAPAPTPALAPSVRDETDNDPLLFEDDSVAETSGEAMAATERSASEAVCEAVTRSEQAAEEQGESTAPAESTEAEADIDIMAAVDNAVDNTDQSEGNEQPECAETDAPACADGQPVDEAPAASVPDDGVSAAGESRQEMAEDLSAQSEISADYIPGSVSDLYDNPSARVDAAEPVREVVQETVEESVQESAADIEAEKSRLAEAQAALAAAAPEVAAETASADEAADIAGPCVPSPVADNAVETRRDRRRREKAEKKQRKRGKKNAAAAAVDLPEIVLTRSEGTETMSVAEEIPTREFALAGETTEAVDEAVAGTEAVADASGDVPALPAPVSAGAEAASEGVVENEAGAEAEAPRMSEPMSLLTPNDVIDDSQAVDESSAVAEVAQPDVQDEAGEEPSAESVQDETEAAPEAEVDAGADVAAMYSGDDHLMIIAGGGVTHEECLAAQAELVAEAEAGNDEAVAEAEGGNNVILFSEKFPVFAGVAADDEDDYDDEAAAGSFLRMLPPVAMDEMVDDEDSIVAGAGEGAEAETALQLVRAEAVEDELAAKALPLAEEAVVAPVAEEAVEPEAPRGEVLTDEVRAALVRAMLGVGDPAEWLVGQVADGADGHVIVSMEPEPEPEDALAREAAVREEMEKEYQSRLDGFAARLLEAQAVAAANETLVRGGKDELAQKDAVIGEMQNRLDEEAEKQKKLAGKLDKAKGMIRERDQELERFGGMRDEHERLYKEFEDLRRAYNEVVTDVMPGLQNERDDLALTVERQCAGEEKLRSSLGSMRKRLAVGYSLGAAACLTLIALPVANWLKSGGEDKELAMQHQQVGELQETLQREVQQNIDAQNTIVELENKVNMARAQILDLQSKNKELARVSQQPRQGQGQGLAVFRPTESGSPGVPARASDMALQATTQANGRLHVNEIRDPAGSIEQVAALNRRQLASPSEPQMARANTAPGGNRPIAMSAVARVDNNRGGNAGALRPGAAVAAVTGSGRNAPTAAAGNAARPRAAAPTAREGEILAKVKKGEGVAQVVYRELGTWDPEVVAWVIRENKISSDKRGNPRIHPDQTLRLPKGGRVGQAASATKRR